MTVFSASALLWEWFQKNDTFSFKDTKQIVPLTENEGVDNGILRLALDNFTKNEMMKAFKVDDEEYWVLNKPWATFEQTVTIGPGTAHVISQVINEACEQFKDERDVCDPLHITEKDVQNLLQIINMYSREGQQED
jgi:hypothetical protein